MSGGASDDELADAVEERAAALTPPAPGRSRRPGAVGRLARRSLQPVTARLALRVQRQIEESLAARVSSEIHDAVAGETRALHSAFAALEAEVVAVRDESSRIQGLLTETADAIAPTAGIQGIAPRFAELRERLNAVERRVRRGDSAPTMAAPASNQAASESIDYVGFERRFRGSSDEIVSSQRDRYVPILQGYGPVLDIGCGKGELLAALAEAGIDGEGVDTDSGMVSEAQQRGLKVECADAIAHLESLAPASLGAIVSVHVVEHVPIDYLVRLLELARTRLRPGGLFVAETPNPASLIVLGTHFILDPTHIRPIHPALMVFLAETAGFSDVRLNFYSPATELMLPLLEDEALPQWAEAINTSLQRLNDVLFGPQEYNVVARLPE